MENLTNIRSKLESLKGKSFIWKRKPYSVKRAEYRLGKCVVFTTTNYLVFEPLQFEEFFMEINIDVEQLTKNNEIMNTEIVPVNTSIEVAGNITGKLVEMFNTLSGNPSDDDYKKAEAMSKVAHTIVTVEQTKINLMKLKDRV